MNPPTGTPVHVRDRVMTSCIEGVVIDQPDVMRVWPDRQSRAGEVLWVRITHPRTIGPDNGPTSLVGADHWHLPEDCKLVRV